MPVDGRMYALEFTLLLYCYLSELLVVRNSLFKSISWH